MSRALVLTWPRPQRQARGGPGTGGQCQGLVSTGLPRGSCREPLTLALAVFKSLQLGLTNGNNQRERITLKVSCSLLDILGVEVLASCLRSSGGLQDPKSKVIMEALLQYGVSPPQFLPVCFKRGLCLLSGVALPPSVFGAPIRRLLPMGCPVSSSQLQPPICHQRRLCTPNLCCYPPPLSSTWAWAGPTVTVSPKVPGAFHITSSLHLALLLSPAMLRCFLLWGRSPPAPHLPPWGQGSFPVLSLPHRHLKSSCCHLSSRDLQMHAPATPHF